MLTGQQVQNFHEDGFLKVTGLYTEAEMEDMEDAFESFIAALYKDSGYLVCKKLIRNIFC